MREMRGEAPRYPRREKDEDSSSEEDSEAEEPYPQLSWPYRAKMPDPESAPKIALVVDGEEEEEGGEEEEEEEESDASSLTSWEANNRPVQNRARVLDVYKVVFEGDH